MTRRAYRSLFAVTAFALTFAAPPAARAADQAGELPAEGRQSLTAEYDKWANVWQKLLAVDTFDPSNTQHQAAVDAAAKWAAYRLTWGLESEPGKTDEVIREFNDNLTAIRLGHERTQKLGESFVKQVIGHASEVMQTRKPIARFNAARLLARIPEVRAKEEQPAEVLSRLTGTNEADLLDACAAAIKDPAQIDAARLYVFRALRNLLALPPQNPPLPREKVEAALGAVVKWMQDRNKDFPPGTPTDEIDGLRYVRREAVEALAQSPFPTLASLPDKPRPALILMKVAARDGVLPEPRLAERIEAAIGVARARPDLDKDYQPDYAAHQIGLFVADFATRRLLSKQGNTEDSLLPWKVDASRLIEALEFMKAQSNNNAHVTRVTDESLKLLRPMEKALDPPNASDFGQLLQAEASPSQQMFKDAPASVVKPANRKDEDAPPEKPEEKKEK